MSNRCRPGSLQSGNCTGKGFSAYDILLRDSETSHAFGFQPVESKVITKLQELKNIGIASDTRGNIRSTRELSQQTGAVCCWDYRR